MSGIGLDWYKREPIAFLTDIQGLTDKEIAVYSVIIDLLYVHGGKINNDPSFIAGYIGNMGTAGVRNTIVKLDARPQITLIITETSISQKRAQNQVKTKRKQSETNAENGRIGGVSSGKSRRENKKNKELDEAEGLSENEPIREEKRRVEEESKASSSTAAAAYDRYLEAHPNRVESYEGELDFAGLVQSGVDPNQIIGAAQEYAKTVATWSDEAFVQQSDNFIHPERGKWRQYVQKAKPPPASMDDVMAFWAEKITAGKYVAPSAIKPDMARQMVAANLVSEDQLRQAGVRS